MKEEEWVGRGGRGGGGGGADLAGLKRKTMNGGTDWLNILSHPVNMHMTRQTDITPFTHSVCRSTLKTKNHHYHLLHNHHSSSGNNNYINRNNNDAKEGKDRNCTSSTHLWG